jgi:hypothetical protein
MADNIQISSQTKNMMNDVTFEEVAQSLYEYRETKTLEMYKAALDFKNAYNDHKQAIELYEQRMIKVERYRSQIEPERLIVSNEILGGYIVAKRNIEEMKLSNAFFDEFFKQVLIFNARILELIYDKPVITSVFVEGDDGQPMLAEYSVEDLMAKNKGVRISAELNRSHNLTGRIRISDYNLLNAMRQAEKTSMRNLNSIAGLSELNATYREAQNEYGRHAKKMVYWKPTWSPYWYSMKVNITADFKEGYAAMFYNHLPEFNGRHLYNNLHAYYTQGVASVDSISGLFAADVEGVNNLYAIKSANAALAGYKQMLLLADKILGVSQEPITIEELKAMAKQRTKNQDGTAKGLRNKVRSLMSTPKFVNKEYKIKMGLI